MKNDFSLTGKRAIITGGAGEIGSAIAKEYHAHGALVAIIDISPNTEAMARSIMEDGAPPAYGVQADISNRDTLRKAFARCVGELGGVDILVNCAGIVRRAPAEDFSEKDWDEVIELNLTSTFLCCQLAGRLMLAQGSGKIINIGSINSFTGGKLICSYAASKGAVVLLTMTLSNEWAARNVQVNAIAPGYVVTKLNSFFRTPAGAEQAALINSRIPAGRWGRPEDLAGAAVFLASSASDWLTGVTLPVDGGFMGR